MRSRARHGFVAASRVPLAAVGGPVVTVIVVLNLHIVAGLEEGYAAFPAEVVDHSVLLAVVDAGLLVGGPVHAVVAALRAGRRVPRRDPRG